MKISECIHLINDDFKRYAEYINRGKKKTSVFKIAVSSILGIGPSQTVLFYRLSRWFLLSRVPFVHFIFCRLNLILNGADISAYADIGPGFFVAHSQGIVIGQNVKCGQNLTIFQNVTIGAKSPFDGKEEMPNLGNNVTLYAGCKVLGPISIGDNVKIGANVVITSNVTNNNTIVVDRTVNLIIPI
ncbi:serine acetyltransferase [Paenibacillus cisolokensis]|uniref:serine O-acetyltransferase n=1 Tax=Paenibacillus cisolokensis TaxID=1658519 RepID=UPI003D2A8F50